MGALSSKAGTPEGRRRAALVGGITGAGVGALAGGLSTMGGIHPQKYVDDLAAAAEKARMSGIRAGHDRGFNAAFNHIGNTPEVLKSMLKKVNPEVRQEAVSPSIVKSVLRGMDPKARDSILKGFSQSFGDRLRRWFGG